MMEKPLHEFTLLRCGLCNKVHTVLRMDLSCPEAVDFLCETCWEVEEMHANRAPGTIGYDFEQAK